MVKENILKSNITTNESEYRKNAMRILKGSIFSILLSIILLFIYAILLTYTNISETTMVPVVLAIVGVSILIGSTISTIKIRKNGLLNGAIVGLTYMVLIYLVSSLCLVGFSLTANSFIMLGVGVLTGIIGGIIGVNLNK